MFIVLYKSKPIFSSVFFHTRSETTFSVFESQLPTITALTKGCRSAKMVKDISEVPAGCGSAVLSDSLTVYILVRVSGFIIFLKIVRLIMETIFF